MVKAWEVRDGVDAIFCETPEDALMVADEWRRRLKVIGYSNPTVTTDEVEIVGFLDHEQQYIEQMRKRLQGNEPAQADQ